MSEEHPCMIETRCLKNASFASRLPRDYHAFETKDLNFVNLKKHGKSKQQQLQQIS